MGDHRRAHLEPGARRRRWKRGSAALALLRHRRADRRPRGTLSLAGAVGVSRGRRAAVRAHRRPARRHQPHSRGADRPAVVAAVGAVARRGVGCPDPPEHSRPLPRRQSQELGGPVRRAGGRARRRSRGVSRHLSGAGRLQLGPRAGQARARTLHDRAARGRGCSGRAHHGAGRPDRGAARRSVSTRPGRARLSGRRRRVWPAGAVAAGRRALRPRRAPVRRGLGDVRPRPVRCVRGGPFAGRRGGPLAHLRRPGCVA